MITHYLQNTDATIAIEVKTSIERHLWYLTELMVVFAFFDEKLDDKVKEAMAIKLIVTAKPVVFPLENQSFQLIS